MTTPLEDKESIRELLSEYSFRIDAFEFSGIFADESMVSFARTPFCVSETELTLPTLTPRKETFAF